MLHIHAGVNRGSTYTLGQIEASPHTRGKLEDLQTHWGRERLHMHTGADGGSTYIAGASRGFTYTWAQTEAPHTH
jgi:hypothetical protein